LIGKREEGEASILSGSVIEVVPMAQGMLEAGERNTVANMRCPVGGKEDGHRPPLSVLTN